LSLRYFLYALIEEYPNIQDLEGKYEEVMLGITKSSLPTHPTYHGRGNKKINKAADLSRCHKAIAVKAPMLLSTPG
jgi:hypothetical protein